MSARPEVTDVVVVGSGAAGFAAAITARRAGLEVLMLEKQAELGGTTARSGTWIWIPNNRLMRDHGLVDPRDDALRYMARLVRPDRYAADHPTLGLPTDEHEMLAAFYDHAGPALDELAAAGALDPVLRAEAPDYFAELPENKAPYGRVVVSRGRERPDQLTGAELVADFAAAARRLGVRAETGVAVTDVLGSDRRVDGVTSGDRRIVARRGVVFATGGFAHSHELMTHFVPVPLRATGAAAGSEGDFLRIAMRLGARLRNMAEAWMAPIPIEPYVNDPTTFTTNIFALRGDSMILVDREGRRVANEKLPYHELASVFLRWDPSTASYPNLRLFMVFDEHTRRLFADGKSGNPIPLDADRADHVVTGATIEELGSRLSERLAASASDVSAGLRLARGFSESLQLTIDRFDAAAEVGVDPDFGRGSSAIELFRNGPPRAGNERNPALYPFDRQGPYHAIILAPASLDTKGGPATDTSGRVLSVSGEPIRGLYAAGNCAGFPSGRAYWAGGATIGIAMTFGWRAARHAASASRGAPARARPA
jgi:succinate dehydrogenase/fumarate reductase flavoprotein subunit